LPYYFKTYQHEQVKCVACHSEDRVCRDEENNVVVTKFSHRIALKVNCGKCHSDPKVSHQLGLPKPEAIKKYNESIHGKALQKGNKDVPDCNYCHGKIHTPSKSLDVLTMCIGCHEDKEKMAKYGLSTYPVISYKESFHGIAQKYGQKGVSVCTDCHNTHDIRSKTTPNHPSIKLIFQRFVAAVIKLFIRTSVLIQFISNQPIKANGIQ